MKIKTNLKKSGISVYNMITKHLEPTVKISSSGEQTDPTLVDSVHGHSRALVKICEVNVVPMLSGTISPLQPSGAGIIDSQVLLC